jgi:hypothetical protein
MLISWLHTSPDRVKLHGDCVAHAHSWAFPLKAVLDPAFTPG